LNEEYLWKWIIQIGFDVYGFDQNAKEDQESIEKASQLCEIGWLWRSLFSFHLLSLVNSFIEEEIKNGIPAERIVSKD
jgi:hypothetical protein